MRKIDQQAWEDRLAYISTLMNPNHAEMMKRVETLKDAYKEYGVTPEEEEAFKMKADDKQVGGNHYKDMAVQPWEIMESLLTREEFIGFLKGNVIKYSMRQGRKDSDDAGKCKHYIEKLKEVTNV
jgi:hypothetical protein